MLPVAGKLYPIAGDWARNEAVAEVHIAYLAPYAYQEFAKVDSEHDWKLAIDTSYALLHSLYFERGMKLPPEKVWIDAHSGAISLARSEDRRRTRTSATTRSRSSGGSRSTRAGTGASPRSPTTCSPRCATSASPSGASGSARPRWRSCTSRCSPRCATSGSARARIYDRYRTNGEALSNLEALPLYATLNSLAEIADPAFALELHHKKVAGLQAKAVENRDTPYYLHNWLWFDEAFWLGEARRHDELLGFLLPFDLRSFRANLPVLPLAAHARAVPGRAPRARDVLAAARAPGVLRQRVLRRGPLSLVALDELAQFHRAGRPVHQHLAVRRRALLLRLGRVPAGAGRVAPRPPAADEAARGEGLRAERRRVHPDLPGAARDPRADADRRSRDALSALRDLRARRRPPRRSARARASVSAPITCAARASTRRPAT